MQQVLVMTYLWLKAGHIIFVIFWMAGLFMLPRFFVYHQEAALDSPENAVWLEREAKLLKIILWPAMIVAWILGLALAWTTGAFTQGWFHAKFGLVLILSAYQLYLAGYHQALAGPDEVQLRGSATRVNSERAPRQFRTGEAPP